MTTGIIDKDSFLGGNSYPECANVAKFYIAGINKALLKILHDKNDKKETGLPIKISYLYSISSKNQEKIRKACEKAGWKLTFHCSPGGGDGDQFPDQLWMELT